AGTPCTARNSEIGKAKNECTRAARHDPTDFCDGSKARVVEAFQHLRLQALLLRNRQQRCQLLLLRQAEAPGPANEDGCYVGLGSIFRRHEWFLRGIDVVCELLA